MRTSFFWAEFAVIALCGISFSSCTVQNTAAGAGGAASGGNPGTSGAATGGGASGSNSTAGTPDPGTIGTCTTTAQPPPAAPAEGMTPGPCDIYAADGGPCVAAHSTVRALYATYNGPLYQVKRDDMTTQDIKPLAAGGIADSAAQDTFCGPDHCTISIIYDQSGQGNHLKSAPGGGAKTTPDNEANAKSIPATFGGKKVYGVHIVPNIGYRNNSACGTAANDDAETEYMVVSGDPMAQNDACCFDYGNMERNSRDNGEGTMEAVYFGTCKVWNQGAGAGPWVMGDLENGLWAGDSSPYANNMPITGFKFVTAMVKGDAAGKNHWTIKSGNAQTGTLVKPFDGARPSKKYNPMRKEGGIGLGTGGDNSNGAKGDWFEGVMTAHYASDMADDKVQASIVSIYGAP